jgi:hypothetical protein
MSDKNLLEETLEFLKENGKTSDDVRWVGSRDGKYAVSWTEFEKIANIMYDSGYGGPEVASDLVVVGDDWWLERHEYDGAEWWEIKAAPVRLECATPFSKAVSPSSVWWDLADINTKE